MEALYEEIHQNQEIVVIDYSHPTCNDGFALMKHSLEYLSGYEKSSAYVLEIVSGVKLSKEMLDFFPEYYDRIKHYVKRWGSVGFGKMIIKEMVATQMVHSRAMHNKNIEWFETKQEAIEFLVGR